MSTTSTNNYGIAHRLSKSLKGLLLAEAFVKIRREGLNICVVELDGKPCQVPKQDQDPKSRVNVNVVDGFIKRSWIG